MYFLALALRAGVALVLGVLFGIAGLLVANIVWPGVVAPMWLMVCMVGGFSATAAFAGYLKPEARWRVMWIGLLVVLAGGIIGAWLGFWYGEVVYPDGVRNVRFVFSPSLKSPPVFAFINGASIGATLLGGLYYGVRVWRYREL